MSYGTKRQAPKKDADMLFAVGYVEDDEIKLIAKGPYSTVGAARGQASQSNRYKHKDTKGEYKLLATKVEWVVIPE